MKPSSSTPDRAERELVKRRKARELVCAEEGAALETKAAPAEGVRAS